MKKTIIILIALSAIFTTCKKEDRDEIFKSRTHRYLTGSWNIKKILINDIDSTSFYLSRDTTIYNWIFVYYAASSDPKITNRFWGYAKIEQAIGIWTLKNRKKIIIGISEGETTHPLFIISKRMVEGYWDIIEIKRNFMRIKTIKDNTEYEYEFTKYAEI